MIVCQRHGYLTFVGGTVRAPRWIAQDTIFDFPLIHRALRKYSPAR